eukprot:7377080-Prymnesium_polylepis.1
MWMCRPAQHQQPISIWHMSVAVGVGARRRNSSSHNAEAPQQPQPRTHTSLTKVDARDSTELGGGSVHGRLAPTQHLLSALRAAERVAVGRGRPYCTPGSGSASGGRVAVGRERRLR